MTTLITDQQRAQLLANGQQSCKQDEFDPSPVVKLFAPDGWATWLLTEIDPEDPSRAFGLCDLGQGFPELGYISLDELASTRGRLGSSIERDRSFKADKSKREANIPTPSSRITRSFCSSSPHTKVFRSQP